jgi:hypothetical protein
MDATKMQQNSSKPIKTNQIQSKLMEIYKTGISGGKCML